jgi:hypothetical protein
MRTAREYPMIGSYFVPVEIFVRFMVDSSPGWKAPYSATNARALRNWTMAEQSP